jgi:hypothetical protein
MGYITPQGLMINGRKVCFTKKIRELFQIREVTSFRVRGDISPVLQITNEIEDLLAHDVTLA